MKNNIPTHRGLGGLCANKSRYSSDEALSKYSFMKGDAACVLNLYQNPCVNCKVVKCPNQPSVIVRNCFDVWAYQYSTTAGQAVISHCNSGCTWLKRSLTHSVCETLQTVRESCSLEGADIESVKMKLQPTVQKTLKLIPHSCFANFTDRQFEDKTS